MVREEIEVEEEKSKRRKERKNYKGEKWVRKVTERRWKKGREGHFNY